MIPLLLVSSAVAGPPVLTTVAEHSGFQRTGRYEEVVRLCADFASTYPRQARCITFGTTPQGREMKALVLSEPPAPKTRPAILVQGGIHAGEIGGKDAGFLVVRDLLEHKLTPGILGKLTVVFVPVLNVDGHERFSQNNRPNQRGPQQMGWRTTAQNLNLNRDYGKAEAPEMQALLRLLGTYDPILYVDLHATDGAKFQHDIAVLVDPILEGGPMSRVARALRDDVIKALNGRGHHALDFYPAFEKWGNPTSGFGTHVAPPRFSQRYWALRNGIGMLVETHSWKAYETRVLATRDLLVAMAEHAHTRLSAWQAARRKAARPPVPGRRVALAWEHTQAKTTIDFLGYAYTVAPSPISGGQRITYDETRPQVWKVPFWPAVRPALEVVAPAGYVVPTEHAAWVRDKLLLHGVSHQVVERSRRMPVQVFRATEVEFASEPYEGRQRLTVKGSWTSATQAVAKGSLYIPRPSDLAVHLFEPQAPDSLLAWGFFNAHFEQKEYMEAYVAEEVAEQMLGDPQLAAAFKAKLQSDPKFAQDPHARLQFFYERHPSWDEKKDLYPVMRALQAP